MKISVRFRTACPRCREILIDPTDVRIVLDATDGTATYEIECPGCSAPAHTSATPAAVEMLLGLGADIRVSSPGTRMVSP